MTRSTFTARLLRTAARASVVAMTASVIAVSSAAAQTKPAAKGKMAGPDIMLMQPTTLKTGDNQFEVMVKGTDGKPLNDADVSVLFVMPKTAAMAEMRNEVKLRPAGNGMYSGPGNVLMAGKWSVTISVKQGGKEIGQKKVALTAK